MKKITTFLILTFLLSSIGYYLIVHSKDLGINPSFAMFYVMWCPGVSGITTCLIYEKGLSGIGWRLGRLKWLGLAYSLPIVYATGAYGFFGGRENACLKEDNHEKEVDNRESLFCKSTHLTVSRTAEHFR